jgi:biotin transporter BioY
VVIALQILLLTGFIGLQLPTATGNNLLNSVKLEGQTVLMQLPQTWQLKVLNVCPELAVPVKKLRFDSYTPLAPVAIFLGYAFGFPIATVAAGLFLLTGLLGPSFGVYPFASGGGLEYYAQPGFGYLIGVIFATWAVAKINEGPRTSLRQLGGLAAGIISLHLIGMTYVLVCSLAFAFVDAGSGSPSWLPWVFEQIRNLSWYSMPYDAMFGIVLIGLGFPVRYLVSILTAPDIGLKSRADLMAQKRMEEILHY